ncbi:amino acid transporter [Candidatus Peregrinibacteria bacterium]|nr:MAG: amino acid transporter [Candidatus Peregrinibacteria bacterium]
MEYLSLIGTVTLIHLLAVMSPGPDFIVAVQNSISYSRKAGIWTAVGFGLGVIVHIFYSIAGLAIVISQSIVLFNVIKLMGAAYLVYIGVKSMTSKSEEIDIEEGLEKKQISSFEAIKMGFLTNVLNPKVTLFFLSLFTMVISPDTPMSILTILSLIIIMNTILWFSLLAIFFTQKKVRNIYHKFEGVFNKTFGGLLVGLGITVAFSQK